MKRTLIIFIILLVLFVVIFKQNTDPKIILKKLVDKGDIKQGDLVYRIYFLGVIPLGEAVLKAAKIEVYNGKEVYHLSATASALKFISKIFKVSAVLDSYVDKELLSPVLFKREVVSPGKEPAHREVYYDQVAGIMTIENQKRQIFSHTQDPLSAIFNLKKIDFDKIKDIEMNINTNQKNYILKGTAKQQEILLGKKTYKIVLARAEIKRRDKNPYHKSKITMVLLKDKENIPVLIKVLASGFLINARLVDIE